MSGSSIARRCLGFLLPLSPLPCPCSSSVDPWAGPSSAQRLSSARESSAPPGFTEWGMVRNARGSSRKLSATLMRGLHIIFNGTLEGRRNLNGARIKGVEIGGMWGHRPVGAFDAEYSTNAQHGADAFSGRAWSPATRSASPLLPPSCDSCIGPVRAGYRQRHGHRAQSSAEHVRNDVVCPAV